MAGGGPGLMKRAAVPDSSRPDRSGPVFRGRLAQRTLIAAIAFVVVAALSVPGLAHWELSLDAGVGTATGTTDLTIEGPLDFDFAPCEPGDHDTLCEKFEDGALDGLPTLDHGVGGFAILGWVDKPDQPGEHVGFYYEVVDGTVDFKVKSGNPENENGSLYEISHVEPGEHMWLNPACELSPGGAVTCDPKNTAAISHIETCLTAEVGAACPDPILSEIVVRNRGSVPLDTALTFSELVEEPPAGVCDPERFELRITTGGVGPPLFVGGLCELPNHSLELGQVDPGRTVALEVLVGLVPGSGATHHGAVAHLTTTGLGRLWNDAKAWGVATERTITVSQIAEPLPLNPPPPPPEPPPADLPPQEPPPEELPPGNRHQNNHHPRASTRNHHQNNHHPRSFHRGNHHQNNHHPRSFHRGNRHQNNHRRSSRLPRNRRPRKTRRSVLCTWRAPTSTSLAKTATPATVTWTSCCCSPWTTGANGTFRC